tara:strand:+ start:571 stop:945 length:375 start_codon:yes stop_codon:yes gene_type:complete
MFFTIIYVLKTIVKSNYKSAFSITVIFVLFIAVLNDFSLKTFISLNFLVSFFIYYFLFIFGLNALKKSKILGFILLSSILFLVPNFFQSLYGILFPVTYMLYIIYIGFEFGTGYFANWKKNEEL